MRRVAFTGISGSGKTTSAYRLAERLGVPFLDLEVMPEEHALQAVGGDGWVSDATHERRFGDLVLRGADTLVWLDLPLWVCILRLWKRETRSNASVLILGALRARRSNRAQVPTRAARHPHLELTRLRAQRDVDHWLAGP